MKKIKTAILSFGMSGRVFHAPFIAEHPGFELAGAWERTKHEFQKYYPQARRFNSYEEILEDQSIELIIINTPTYTHYDFAKQALQANKHVIVEKAFTTTLHEAEELASLAKSKGLTLSVYQNRRWDSDYLTVCKVIESSRLGEIRDVTFSFERFNPNLSPKEHKEKKGPGAGLLMDLGPHLIDQALNIFGMPEAVFGTMAIRREHSVVDDYFEITLFYAGFNVKLRSGYFVKKPLPAFVVHGTKGSFIKSRADIQETALQNGEIPGRDSWGLEPESEYGKLYIDSEGGTLVETIPSLPGNYMKYFDGIYEAITNKKLAPVTAQEGVQIMKIIDSVVKSNNKKRLILL